MSEQKHTKGPWVANGRGGESHGGSTQKWPCFMGSIKGWKDQPIVQQSCLLGVQGATPEEAEANARLIAKSPTMYEYIQRKATEGDKDAAEIIASI